MSTRDALFEEIKKVPDDLLKEVYDYLLFLKHKKSSAHEDKLMTHIVSEQVLARDWNTQEEDEAWKNL